MRIYKNRYTFCLFLTLIILSSGRIFFPINNSSFEPISEWKDGLNLSDDELVINTPENKTYTKPMDGYYPATYGFENDEDGSDPDEWTMYEAGGYVNVKDAMGNHTKVVEMYDSVNNNHVLMSKPVPSQTSGTVEYWVMSDNVGRESIFRALEDPFAGAYGDGIGWLCLDQNKIRYYDNIGWHDTSKTIYDNTWYRIKVEFECTTGNYHGLDQYTWRFYVDGEEFGAFPFQVNINNVSQVFFSTRGEDLGYRCYVDAIGFSWDLDYNIGDNLHEGLLLGYETNMDLDWKGYSLDEAANKTILGNTTIPMPSVGIHSIQMFGNNSMGTMYESGVRYFTVNAITLISPENKTYTQPDSGYYPATYGFENDEEGTFPEGWNDLSGSGCNLEIINEFNDHHKVVKFDDQSTKHGLLKTNFTSNITLSTVEFWIYPDTSSYSTVNLWSDLSLVFPTCYFLSIQFVHDTNTIRYIDGPVHPDNYHTFYYNYVEKWYHIRFDIDYNKSTYDIYIDSVKFVDDGQFRNPAYQCSNITFGTWLSTTGVIYLDAVGLSTDTNYNLGDNLHEGLLLGYETNMDLDWMGYSLDNKANITIMGDKTISMPRNGSHVIQVFGNDSLGDIFHSEKRYFTMHYNSVDIITPENITYTVPMVGYFPGTYGFENDQNGDIPEGWVNHTGIGYTIEVIDEKYGHKKVVELIDNTVTNNPVFMKNFAAHQTTGTIEFWLATTNAEKGTVLSFQDPSTHVAFQVEIDDGKIKFLYQGHQYLEYVMENDQWRHIRIDFNCITDKVTFWLDQNQLGPALNFYTAIDYIGKFFISTNYGDSAYSSYIDAFGYSWDPYYHVGDNNDEGILFNYDDLPDFAWREFSLNSQPRQPILGHKTLPVPEDGTHSIQFFAQDSLGDYYESEMRFFTIEIAPSVEWVSPGDEVTVILPYSKAPYANDGVFTFQYTYRLLDDIELEIDGTNLGSVFNKTSIVLTPYTDYTNGFLSATLIGINNSVIVDSDTRNFQFVKITHEITQILNSSTQIIGKQLYLILHDPHGDNSFSSISESTTLSIGVGSQITNALGVSVEVGAEFSLFGVSTGASVLLEAKETLTQGYDFRYEIKETTSLTSSQVTDDADYIGSGYGDRYWGESWIYKWVLNGTYREYSNVTMNGWENPKLYYGILRGVETFASDEHAPAEWRNQNAAYNDTIPVSWITPFQESGGAPYIFENEVSTTTRRTTSFQIDLGADFELKFGDLETHATIELSVKNYAEIEVGNIHKVAYHIEDDDPSDFLVQWIGIDEQFGTYIFESDPFLCETSHPLEHNTYDYLPPVIDFPTINFDTNNDDFGPANDDSPLVRVNIFEEGGLQDVAINYTINAGQSWVTKALDELVASPGLWEGSIPPLTQGTTIKWYIIAWDSQGNRAERKDIYGNPFEYTVLEKPFVPSYPPMFIIISLMIPIVAIILRNRKKLNKINT